MFFEYYVSPSLNVLILHSHVFMVYSVISISCFYGLFLLHLCEMYWSFVCFRVGRLTWQTGNGLAMVVFSSVCLMFCVKGIFIGIFTAIWLCFLLSLFSSACTPQQRPVVLFSMIVLDQFYHQYWLSWASCIFGVCFSCSSWWRFFSPPPFVDFCLGFLKIFLLQQECV